MSTSVVFADPIMASQNDCPAFVTRVIIVNSFFSCFVLYLFPEQFSQDQHWDLLVKNNEIQDRSPRLYVRCHSVYDAAVSLSVRSLLTKSLA